MMPAPKPGYTRTMTLIEALLKVDLKEFLFEKSDSTLAKELGVSEACISRWRRRFMCPRCFSRDIEYHQGDNLWTCRSCEWLWSKVRDGYRGV